MLKEATRSLPFYEFSGNVRSKNWCSIWIDLYRSNNALPGKRFKKEQWTRRCELSSGTCWMSRGCVLTMSRPQMCTIKDQPENVNLAISTKYPFRQPYPTTRPHGAHLWHYQCTHSSRLCVCVCAAHVHFGCTRYPKGFKFKYVVSSFVVKQSSSMTLIFVPCRVGWQIISLCKCIYCERNIRTFIHLKKSLTHI